jgi:hypothetical protein
MRQWSRWFPLAQSRPSRGAISSPSHVLSPDSNVVTLKAYPPGHTGKAAPAPTSTLATPQAVDTGTDSIRMWREYQVDTTALAQHGVERAGYQIVDTTPQIIFALGFVDDKGGIVDIIPEQEVLKLFPEFSIKCLDDGVTYQISKLFGQQLSELERVVKERLQGVKIFDVTDPGC